MQDEEQSVNALENHLDESGVNQEQENLEEKVNPELSEEKEDKNESKEGDLPSYAKERLGIQKKRYDKEIRNLKRQLYELQVKTAQKDSNFVEEIPKISDPSDVKGQVFEAISELAQRHSKELENHKKLESIAHIEKKYIYFQEQLDKGSDVYDDFDEIVRDENAPFTTAMRDAGMLIDNPADVFYALGKNRKELNRIANLHPLEQGREIVKLSANLSSKKVEGSKAPKPIENIKSNPAVKSHSSSITNKSSVSEIRKHLKNNSWRR